jgi:hypothetical protein
MSFKSFLIKKVSKRFYTTTKAPTSSFYGSNRGEFFQDGPVLGNQYDQDPFMQEQLTQMLPKEYFKEISEDLKEFGNKVSKEILYLHRECERNVPQLEQFDAWGRRVDKLITCDAWKQQKKISAQEGLIAIPYEKKYSIYSRLYQIVKLYMYAPSSGLYSCPLAMTDGAARTLQLYLDQNKNENELITTAFARLTSRNPNEFWTSGQWMTERKGGSDVGKLSKQNKTFFYLYLVN